MKKIPTLYVRDETDRSKVTPQITPGCEWVIKGEGTATRKYDGTACLILEGSFWKRREVKRGKPIPADFFLEEIDEITGKLFGWVPVDPDDKSNKYHMEALYDGMPDGTYELIGPKIQGNPEHANFHYLQGHKIADVLADAPRDFEGLKTYLRYKDIEGIVFHHPDGRMAKIKKRDFGWRR